MHYCNEYDVFKSFTCSDFGQILSYGYYLRKKVKYFSIFSIFQQVIYDQNHVTVCFIRIFHCIERNPFLGISVQLAGGDICNKINIIAILIAILLFSHEHEWCINLMGMQRFESTVFPYVCSMCDEVLYVNRS